MPPALNPAQLEAVEHGDTLVFLHGVRDGPANQSYGLQVAALAGIPKDVITAARRYLAELERERDALRSSVSPEAQLPLFAARPASAPPVPAARPPAESAALGVLRAVDPEALSPREALDLVFRLKQLDADRSS